MEEFKARQIAEASSAASRNDAILSRLHKLEQQAYDRFAHYHERITKGALTENDSIEFVQEQLSSKRCIYIASPAQLDVLAE